MLEKYEVMREIGPSICDFEGKLSYAEAFGLFMDIASTHAEMLGIGVKAMAQKNLFWLTVKTQINFIRRPSMLQGVSLQTYPEKPDKMRGNRSYILSSKGNTLMTGKTEWAVIDTKTHKLVPLQGIYPAELCFDNESSCMEPYAEYRVRSTDIDVGGHMNNTAYARAVMGTFSVAELKSMNINRMDIIFRSSCYEGERLDFRRKQTETGLDIRVSRGEETVLLVRIQ